MSTDLSRPAEPFQLEHVETELQRIPLSSIVVRHEDFSFRDEDDLVISGDAIKSLGEDIKAHGGIHTPLQVQQLPDGRHLLLDGHRRFFALQTIVQERVEGFEPDMAVPAIVNAADASELAMVARAVSANVQREPLSAEGRLRAVIRLKRLGMPRTDSARAVEKSVSTIDRDIALGSDDEMMEHVGLHHIPATTAAELIKLATEAQRLDEFKEEFNSWVGNVQQRLEEEEAARADADESSLSPVERWPQRYLSPEQVKAWKEALGNQTPFAAPSFKFKALLRDEKGRRRIEIDPLSEDVFDLSSEDLAKVMERCLDLAADIEPVLIEKVEAERRAAESPEFREGERPGRRRLRELGLNGVAAAAEESDQDEADQPPGDQASPTEPTGSIVDLLGGVPPQGGTEPTA